MGIVRIEASRKEAMKLADIKGSKNVGFETRQQHTGQEQTDLAVDAFGQSAPVPGEDHLLFQGTLKKVSIVSNNIGYGLMPGPEEEIEQRLTINDEGCVWFSGYHFGRSRGRYEKARSKIFKIEKADADRLLGAISAYFSSGYTEVIATDIGDWAMELTNTEGITYQFRGSLCADFDYEGTDLSDLVRDVIGMDDLYVFDGNDRPEYIFCSVVLDGSCKRYYYLTDDDSIEIGDLVLVPAGEADQDASARVVDIEFFREEDAPLPIEKTKWIICNEL